jgi:sugar/nucleoside kinase (ribokinase family)
LRIPFSIRPAGRAAFDVIGFGLNSIDLVGVVQPFPQSNTKQRLRQFAQLPGGQIATAMAVCARLGWKARYLGRFGDDAFGRAARESLEKEGVNLDGARSIPGATNQFAMVLVDERTGERTVLWHRHEGLATDPDEIDAAAVGSGRVLIVDCFETEAAARAAEYARAAGVATIVDVEHVRPAIDSLLRNIDAIIAAEQFPLELTGYDSLGKSLEAIEREFAAPLVCVTLGEKGSLARCGGREIRTPGFPIACVDTTGAGDAFRGGFAAGCLREPDGSIEDVLTYANAVAALNCRALGARGGIPTADEVERLIATR